MCSSRLRDTCSRKTIVVIEHIYEAKRRFAHMIPQKHRIASNPKKTNENNKDLENWPKNYSIRRKVEKHA